MMNQQDRRGIRLLLPTEVLVRILQPRVGGLGLPLRLVLRPCRRDGQSRRPARRMPPSRSWMRLHRSVSSEKRKNCSSNPPTASNASRRTASAAPVVQSNRLPVHTPRRRGPVRRAGRPVLATFRSPECGQPAPDRREAVQRGHSAPSPASCRTATSPTPGCSRIACTTRSKVPLTSSVSGLRNSGTWPRATGARVVRRPEAQVLHRRAPACPAPREARGKRRRSRRWSWRYAQCRRRSRARTGTARASARHDGRRLRLRGPLSPYRRVAMPGLVFPRRVHAAEDNCDRSGSVGYVGTGDAHAEQDSCSGKPLRPGDVVEVRPAAEILATLDADGALDGMPFMPEMARVCGPAVHGFAPGGQDLRHDRGHREPAHARHGVPRGSSLRRIRPRRLPGGMQDLLEGGVAASRRRGRRRGPELDGDAAAELERLASAGTRP